MILTKIGNLYLKKRIPCVREKGTEPPFNGKYHLNSEDGIYKCKGCGEDLFYSASK